MKIAKTIGYWTTTGFGYLSGAMDEAIAELGYPPSFITWMGMLKLLGAIALLVPALPRAKEWVYAGFFFVFTGAAWSHAAIGHDIGHIAPPLVMLVLLVGSYFLRPARLWLGGAPRISQGPADMPQTQAAK